MDSINSAWEKIIPRIQFSVERDEIYNISLNIARLRGSIASEDKASTLGELNEIIENWEELSRRAMGMFPLTHVPKETSPWLRNVHINYEHNRRNLHIINRCNT